MYYTGPGPAEYNIPGLIGKPTNEGRFSNRPAYVFGVKPSEEKKNPSCVIPGPNRYDYRNMTRKGVPKSVGWILGVKAENKGVLRNIVGMPGPNNYQGDKLKYAKSSPAYSFGLKPSQSLRYQLSPSPLDYEVPTTFGSNSPAFVFGVRGGGGYRYSGPAANNYRTVPLEKYKPTAPAFSILGKPSRKKQSFQPTPGPMSFKEPPIYSPAYSFGLRYSPKTFIPKTKEDLEAICVF